VHIPWCVHKCPYCDFNSHGLKNKSINEYEEIYTEAIINQVSTSQISSNSIIPSIFFGGGTPSLFSPSSIEKILLSISDKYALKKDCEITLEANPGTIDQRFFKGYKKVGINRVSLGIQSFNDKHLKSLERIHSSKQAFSAALEARAIFDNINLDLMYALPNQTIAELYKDVNQALSIEPEHISYYHLTIEPNTLFHKFPPNQPNDDVSADMGDLITHKLENFNYQHYETSAYAKKNKECKHNLNYWRFGDYLGIGAGAHSKITSNNEQQHRFICFKSPSQYMNGAKDNNFFIESKKINNNEVAFEFMMNALRLNQGFTKRLFEEKTKLNIEEIRYELSKAKDKKFIIETDDMIIPTQLGRNFLNELLQIFMRDN
jgi:oxygen-independent coproporphyrinogen-3 oxidase